MGGRGARSGGAGGAIPGVGFTSAAAPPPIIAPTPNPAVANQAPTPQNTPVTPGGVTTLSQMTDDQLATLMRQSRHVDMPNHLSDVDDATQKFVYAAGLNEKPQVLDTNAFNQYMSANGIRRSEVLARSVGSAQYSVNGTNIRLTPTQVTSMIKDSSLTYVGGKFGGMLHGAGTYFDMNGGRPTGYSNGATALAVLSKNAHVIDESALRTKTASFMRSHPKFASAVGAFSTRNMSIYALAQGYNVIRAGSYHNVIERSALVMRRDDY